jgi:hypothetical protein
LNFFNQIKFLLIVIIFEPINLTELLQTNPPTIYFFYLKKTLTILTWTFPFILKKNDGTGAKLKEIGPGASKND